MLIPRLVARVCLIGTVVLSAGIAYGQTYPSKPIRIVTPELGGGGDFLARLVAPGLTAGLGQPVIIHNRPSGVIPGDTVAKAPADGYTVLVNGSSHWLAQFLQDQVPYDAIKDFSPITLAQNSPNILVVNPSLGTNSVKDLIALAKAKPGTLNYGSVAAGSATHLSAELFKTLAGVDIVRIPYKGAGAVFTDLISGRVQLMFATAGSVAPHVKSGKLTALAVTSARPSALLPGLPTVAASGLPGYESVSMTGMFAPAKTPVAIVRRLNQEMVQVLNGAQVKERLFNAGVEVVGSTPEEFAATVKAEIAKWGKVIKDAGIKAD